MNGQKGFYMDQAAVDREWIERGMHWKKRGREIDSLSAKEAVKKRLGEGRMSVSVHGRTPLMRRNLFQGLAAGVVLGAVTMVTMLPDPSQATQNAQSAPPAMGAFSQSAGAEVFDLKLPGGGSVRVLSGAGLPIDQLAQDISEKLHYNHGDAQSLSVHLAQNLTGAEQRRNPAAALYEPGECLVYQHEREHRSLSPLHDYLRDPQSAPNQAVQGWLENMDGSTRRIHQPLSDLQFGDNAMQERYVLLHELNHCYYLALVNQAKDTHEIGQPTYDSADHLVLPRLQEVVNETYQSAARIAAEHPGVSAEKLSQQALSQLAESVADVFALSALYQNGTPEQLQSHAQRILLSRDLERTVGSSHDSVNVLYALQENATSVHWQLQGIRPVFAADQARAAKEHPHRLGQMDPDAFSHLSLFAVDFALSNMEPPGIRMRQMLAHTVADADQSHQLNAASWNAARNVFQGAKPAPADLEQIKQSLLAKGKGATTLTIAARDGASERSPFQ